MTYFMLHLHITFYLYPTQEGFKFYYRMSQHDKAVKNNPTQPINQEWNCNNTSGVYCTSQIAPVSRMSGGLQQLQLPLVRKHVLVLHQQAIGSQLREQLDQLRTGDTQQWRANTTFKS